MYIIKLTPVMEEKMRLRCQIIIFLLFFTILLTFVGSCRGLNLSQQEEAVYILKMDPIIESLTDSVNDFTQDFNCFKKADISLSEYKEELRKFIEEINFCYGKYKKIKAPEKLKVYDDAFSEAMESYHKASIHFQDFIDTDDTIEMQEHAIYAFIEIAGAKRWIEKANEEYQKYLGD